MYIPVHSTVLWPWLPTLSQMYPHSNWNFKFNTKLRLEFQVEYGFKLEFQVEQLICRESADQSRRWQVECKTDLIRKVMNFIEKNTCRLLYTEHDWCSITWTSYYVLICWPWSTLVCQPGRPKWHQIQSMGLFLVYHIISPTLTCKGLYDGKQLLLVPTSLSNSIWEEASLWRI